VSAETFTTHQCDRCGAVERFSHETIPSPLMRPIYWSTVRVEVRYRTSSADLCQRCTRIVEAALAGPSGEDQTP
jgi:hypothetical protein